MYTVIYRTGGWANAKWHKTTPVLTMVEAKDRKAEIKVAGRKAIIHTTKGLAAHGLPVGYCARCDAATGKCTNLKGCASPH